MQMIAARKFFASLLVLLCLGFAPQSVSSSAIVAPGVPSLAKERVEPTFAPASQRNPIQVLVSARDPLPPFTGGSIAAVLPGQSSLTAFGGYGSPSFEPSSAGPSFKREYQRARSPPLS